MNKKTKIVCTIGPSSEPYKTLVRLVKEGLDVVRINFSHGNYEQYDSIINTVRKIEESVAKPISILQDLRGPKLRIGKLKAGSIFLKKNNEITLTTENVPGDNNIISSDFKELPRYIRKGESILLDDGNIELSVKNVSGKNVLTRVIEGGELKSNKGINLPHTKLKIPAFTDKDKKDVLYGIKKEVDFIALSFVQSADDILELKKFLASRKSSIPVIAKIEKPAAIKNLDSIIEASDGIMVARGDLGVEMAESRIPILQKDIISKSARKGKFIITATQMLESMIKKPHPTRAETTDIANAILDLSDAVMLSAETAVGKYPVRAVKMMGQIAEITEKSPYFKSPTWVESTLENTIMNTVVKSAVEASENLDIRCIVVFTISSMTALMLSKYRPPVPIIAFSPDIHSVRKMSMYWGVRPVYMKEFNNTDKIIQEGENILKKRGLVKLGDLIVMVTGATQVKGATNTMRILKV